MQKIESLLTDSAKTLSVPPEHLPISVERFFGEWKDLNKENERLKEELAHSIAYRLMKNSYELQTSRLLWN